jgi:hypothetical protein
LVRHAGVPEVDGGRRALQRHVKFRTSGSTHACTACRRARQSVGRSGPPSGCGRCERRHTGSTARRPGCMRSRRRRTSRWTTTTGHWQRVIDRRSYLNGLGLDWSRVRNVINMRAAYGG